MKSWIVVLLTIAICLVMTGQVAAQDNYSIINNRSYGNDTVRTATLPTAFVTARHASILYKNNDSTNVRIILQKQYPGSATWVDVDSTTIDSATSSSTGYTVEWVIRNNTVEKIPTMYDTRVKVFHRSYRNGLVPSTNRETVTLKYSK